MSFGELIVSQQWVPAISTTGMLAFVLWLCKSWLAKRLTESIRSEYDTKLESLKSELRRHEESFRAELRAKDTQIDALRSGALTALASRQAALDKRRIEATEQIWAAVVDLEPAKVASTIMSGYNFKLLAKESVTNEKVRLAFATVGEGVAPGNMPTNDAMKIRPFLSEIAWALFSAYQAILYYAVGQIQLIKSGVGEDFMNTEKVNNLVRAALPHHDKLIEKYGSDSYHLLLDELETGLLKELKNMLEGKESDQATLAQAMLIISESENLMNAIRSPNASHKD